MFCIALCAVLPVYAVDKQALKYYDYAMAYHKQKNYTNAITYYNAAVKKERKFWQAWLGLGICYYSLKKFRNAKLIFRYVLTIKPDEPTAKKYYNTMAGIKDDAGSKKEEEKKVVTKGDMLWRSALLPGLGQFYNDELIKGYLYALSYLASIGGIIKYTIDQQQAVDAYNNANSDFAEKYKTAETATTRVYIPIGCAALIWSMSMIDAWISGRDDVTVIKKGYGAVEMRGDMIAMNIVKAEF